MILHIIICWLTSHQDIPCRHYASCWRCGRQRRLLTTEMVRLYDER
jgi:hypothetical protein